MARNGRPAARRRRSFQPTVAATRSKTFTIAVPIEGTCGCRKLVRRDDLRFRESMSGAVRTLRDQLEVCARLPRWLPRHHLAASPIRILAPHKPPLREHPERRTLRAPSATRHLFECRASRFRRLQKLVMARLSARGPHPVESLTLFRIKAAVHVELAEELL
jgi:hypothetical protein